jgi:cyanate permease
MHAAFFRSSTFVVTAAAAGILMVTMGVRQSVGLFISPIELSTGVGIATISLALAIGQFMWGAVQPLAGALADRVGPRPVLVGSLVLLAAGSVLRLCPARWCKSPARRGWDAGTQRVTADRRV